MSADILVVTTVCTCSGVPLASGTWWVEAWGAAQHPTVHGPSPSTEFSRPRVNGVEVGKSCVVEPLMELLSD